MASSEQLSFGTVATPPPALTEAERRRRYVATHPERAAETREAYAATRDTRQPDSVYLSRPFVAWDGEGYDDENGDHIYNILAGKGDGDSVSIRDNDGLQTERIFETLLGFAEKHPNAIHVIYGGNYDFNSWLKDLSRNTVEKVYKNTRRDGVRWHSYKIYWRQRRMFSVKRVDAYGKPVGKSITVYDIVSFFAKPFVGACDDYLGDNFVDRDLIVAEKANRGKFVPENLDHVADYNDAELVNLIALATELRERLNKVGLRPRTWDSCGQLAAALMQQHGIKQLIQAAEIPSPVQTAARFAYAGGRFETIKFGYAKCDVYEYDINSAYPYALTQVPDISDGEWEYIEGDPGHYDFALYNIESHTPASAIPSPLFCRGWNGQMFWPKNVIGWYWTPEYDLWSAYVERGHSTGKVIGAYVFHPNTDKKPFDFIGPLYRKRAALKRGGDGSHVGIKLALNSLYGKLAQQVGASQNKDGTWKVPPFHCLEYAGYATSRCRADIVMTVIDSLEDVISFETDAVFTLRDLQVPDSNELGGLKLEKFKDITYVKSGIYFATSADGTVSTSKTRGIRLGAVHRDDVMENMFRHSAANRTLAVTDTLYIGAGTALQGKDSWKRWRRWEQREAIYALYPTGKRLHHVFPSDCSVCQREINDEGRQYHTIYPNELHDTVCILEAKDMKSHEFPVMWVNPNPDMPFENLREEGYLDDNEG